MATIITKNSSTASSVPTAAQLVQGELAVNVTDKRLFTENASGTVVELGTNPSSLTLPNGTANGVPYLNGSKILTTGSALTFDGSAFWVAATSVSTDSLNANGFRFGSGTFKQQFSGGFDFQQYYTAAGQSTPQAAIFADTGAWGVKITGSEQMRLTSTGLGLGTSLPGAKLHVNGAVIVDSYMDFRNAGSAKGNIYVDASNMYINTQGTNTVLNGNGGNLGLGVTPSALLWPNGSAGGLQLQAGALLSAYNATTYLSNNWYYNAGEKYIGNGYATRYEQTQGKHAWYYAGNNTSGAGATVSWTQAMTLDAAGFLGIGPTSPTAPLDVLQRTSDDDNALQLRGYTTGADGTRTVNVRAVSSNAGDWANLQFKAQSIRFIYQGSTERARIDSSGNLLVGTTSAGGQAGLSILPNNSSGAATLFWDRASTASTSTALNFENGNSTVGSVTYTNTGTAYNTTSDYRLKENIQPMTGALAKVAQLKPCTYKWKADGSEGEGFIAHELQAVVPQCVTGEKDAVDADGNPVYQGIDTSFLVATLTAAIQELKAEFDAYKAAHP